MKPNKTGTEKVAVSLGEVQVTKGTSEKVFSKSESSEIPASAEKTKSRASLDLNEAIMKKSQKSSRLGKGDIKPIKNGGGAFLDEQSLSCSEKSAFEEMQRTLSSLRAKTIEEVEKELRKAIVDRQCEEGTIEFHTGLSWVWMEFKDIKSKLMDGKT